MNDVKVIKNFIYNASYQIFMLLVPLLTTPYLARTIGTKGVGINSFTDSVIQYFILLGCMGTNMYANRKIAFVRDDKNELSNSFWEIFIMRMCLLIFSIVLFLFFLLFTDKQYRLYYVAQGVTIFATIFDISWFFMGIEEFNVIVIKNFFVRLVTLSFIFLFVKSFSDLYIYILIISCSNFIGNVTMFSNLKTHIKKPVFKELNIIKHFMPSLILFVPEISAQIYLVLNKTMLGVLVSVQSSGFYDQSDKIIKMSLAVVTSTGMVMLPKVANAFARGEVNKTKEYLYDGFSIVTAMSMPMFFGIIAISNKFVPLFFTDKFIIVSDLLAVESFVIIFTAWSSVLGTQYLIPTKQVRKYTISLMSGAVTNIILNVPLIILYGTMGAIVATALSELAVTTYQMISVRDQISIKLLFKDFYKYVISGAIMFLVVYLLNYWLPFTWSSLIAEISSGIIVYLSLIYLFRSNVFNVIKKIRNEY